MKVKLPSETKDSKDIVFDIFSKLGVNSFCVNFDGSGDDGSIQDPEDFKPASKSKDAESELDNVVVGSRVSNGVRYSHGSAETIWKENVPLLEIIQGVCYDALQNVRSGWEINEGSYGTFTFDVKKRKVHLEFNERVVDVELTEYEF